MSWTDEDIRNIWDASRAKINGRYLVSDNPERVMELLKTWKSIGEPGIFSVWLVTPYKDYQPVEEEIDMRIPGVGC